MPTKEDYLAICQVCPYRERRCVSGQSCACTADGADIQEHAREGHCPMNLYPVPPAPRPAQSAPLPPSTASMIAHGAAGIARAVTGTGGADAQLIEKRTAICTACDQNVLSLGLIHR